MDTANRVAKINMKHRKIGDWGAENTRGRYRVDLCRCIAMRISVIRGHSKERGTDVNITEFESRCQLLSIYSVTNKISYRMGEKTSG